MILFIGLPAALRRCRTDRCYADLRRRLRRFHSFFCRAVRTTVTQLKKKNRSCRKHSERLENSHSFASQQLIKVMLKQVWRCLVTKRPHLVMGAWLTFGVILDRRDFSCFFFLLRVEVFGEPLPSAPACMRPFTMEAKIISVRHCC